MAVSSRKLAESLESSRMLRVIYIMGSGHSGSTVLDALLGSHPDIVGVGELSHFFRDEWMNEQYCSCGTPLNDCEFWSDVRSRIVRLRDANRQNELMRLVRSVERIRRIPALRKSRFGRTQSFQDYAELSLAVFQAISDVSGSSVIVDSSKNPARMLALSLIPNLDLRIIHLVRDGRAVAYSYRKPFHEQPTAGVAKNRASQSVWGSALSWRFTNVVSEYAAARVGRPRALLRYEDFVVDYAAAFRELAVQIDIDLHPVVEDIRAGVAIEFEHRLAGNPVRMNRGVTLALDQKWTDALSEREKLLFWGIAGSMARKYGYEKHVTR